MIEERCLTCFMETVDDFIRDYNIIKKSKLSNKYEIGEKLWKEFNNTICASHCRKAAILRSHVKHEPIIHQILFLKWKEVKKIYRDIPANDEPNYVDELFTEIFSFKK